MVNPGKIFHSTSIGSPSILSKALYSGELLNHVHLSSHAMFDFGFSFIFPRHNTESENMSTFACERLMISSSLTRDICFHEESSELLEVTPWISSDLFEYQLFRYVKHLFHREIVTCLPNGA